MKYSVEGSTLQEVLNYLATRPFAEVAKLINDLQTNAKPLETEAAATPPPAEAAAS